MTQTLITRLTLLKQLNKEKSTILYEDPAPSRWRNVYGALNINDNVIFISSNEIHFCVIREIDPGKSFYCEDVESLSCSNDQFLQQHGVFPELIARVKANFQPFIHERELDIKRIKQDIQNGHFISFYIFPSKENFETNKKILKDFDRLVFVDEKECLSSLFYYHNGKLNGFENEIGKNISVSGLTLQQILDINKANVDTTTKRSNNLNRVLDIVKSIEKNQHFRFTSFFTYYDSLFNKRMYSGNTVGAVQKGEHVVQKEFPLNQILFGPPGTGKTYTTINKAIEIADPGFEFEDKKRFEIVQHFHELKEEGKIDFITFHQAFSYEDFIEGIKPVMHDSDEEKSEVKYEIRPGVFKRICDKARGIGDFEIKNEENIDFEHASFYKMSLGGKNKPHIHDWCINNNKLSLGWGGDADLSHLKQYNNNWNQFKEAFQKQYPKVVEESRYHIQASFIFLKMKKGDVVLVSKGNKIIDAIGVISDNDYIYNPNQEFDYCHYRNVEWLATDLNASPELFVSKNISQQSIYEFYDADVKREYFNLKFNKNEEPEEPENYVLVIDEINRGNIAAIFGELITLLEPDKRMGAENELTATLPYSGKDEKPFGVPPNLYIIGTMNTADRSVEALDAALRRRFSFEEMPPRYDLDGLNYKFEDFNAANILKTINRRIEKILDKDHLIGHSYFIKQEEEDAKTVLEKALFEKIIPLLQEYFYGDIGKINLILGNGFIEVEKDADNIFPKSNYENNDYLERKIFKLIPKENVNLKVALELMEIKRD